MPQPNGEWYPLDTLYLFHQYQTREEYEKKTGQKCPPWNPNRPPKLWYDSELSGSTSRRASLYPTVIAYADNGSPLRNEEGRPYTEDLLLTQEEAGSVNIPLKGPGYTNIPGADAPPVPCPIRALLPNEQLRFGPGGMIQVWDLNYHPPANPGDFTVQDRADLKLAIDYLQQILRLVQKIQADL